MIEYTPNAIHIPCDCERCVKIEAVIERLKKFFNGDNILTKSEYKQKIIGEDFV